MSIEVLETIADVMKEINMPYAFMEYKAKSGKPPKTYFVGEYQEMEPASEDGEQNDIFIITGFSREAWLVLEEAKKKIKEAFPPIGGRVAIVGSGSAVAIFYASSFPVPTEDAELKKMQINLSIKGWSVK